MAAVPFNTLKLARRLESAGFPPKQAGDTAEALAYFPAQNSGFWQDGRLRMASEIPPV
jgi:hypothetical protein